MLNSPSDGATNPVSSVHSTPSALQLLIELSVPAYGTRNAIKPVASINNKWYVVIQMYHERWI